MRVDALAPPVLPNSRVRLEREFGRHFAERLETTEQILITHARQAVVEEHRRRRQDRAAVGVVMVLRDRRIADAHRAVATVSLYVAHGLLVDRIGGADT